MSHPETVEHRRIMVIEDDRPLRTTLETLLGDEGFQTSLRLAGSSIGEVKRLDFQRPSRDD